VVITQQVVHKEVRVELMAAAAEVAVVIRVIRVLVVMVVTADQMVLVVVLEAEETRPKEETGEMEQLGLQIFTVTPLNLLMRVCPVDKAAAAEVAVVLWGHLMLVVMVEQVLLESLPLKQDKAMVQEAMERLVLPEVAAAIIMVAMAGLVV
tara:strand:- start:44 stop:496 length:453 start_codon:yes stop_codon:yes gene_type:complete